jgi:hypothetical protein
VRQWQPDRAQLQQAWSFGIKNPARYIDVRDGISIKKHPPMLQTNTKRNQRYEDGE